MSPMVIVVSLFGFIVFTGMVGALGAFFSRKDKD